MGVRHRNRIINCRVIKMESGIAAALTRDGGKDDSTIRLVYNRESAAKQNGVGDGGSPGPGRWEGQLNHSSRLK